MSFVTTHKQTKEQNNKQLSAYISWNEMDGYVYHTALTQFILQQMERFTVADKVQPVCTVPAVQTLLAQ